MPITAQIQTHKTREPRQERSRHKVQLIFEATIRLLEKGGLQALNTNAIAASAGVSIGTLYQFFANKDAILDALADQEVAGMSDRVTQAMHDQALATTEARITAVVRAVTESYGARRTAHKVVLEHSLSKGGNRMAPLLTKMIVHLSSERNTGAIRQALAPADAFVLAHAFSGVLRAMIRGRGEGITQDEVATSLARLVVRFVR
jgi:AcrR family transcriptional regulator